MPPKKRAAPNPDPEAKKQKPGQEKAVPKPPAPKADLANDPLKLVPLFRGAEEWMDVLKPVIEAQPDAARFIGPDRGNTVVPVREMTFQALKPNPPEKWKVVIFGQTPYPRVESATGIAMFDNTFHEWADSRFGKVTSMRCIMKQACMWKWDVKKETPVADIRALLKKHKIVQPPEWFQSMLTQGLLLLNAGLTSSTDDSIASSAHAKFWRPICMALIREIFRAKNESKDKANRGVVFAWWGTSAVALKKQILAIEDEFPNVSVRHIDYHNPAAQGDMFCASQHFREVNEELASLGMEEIDFLPNTDWQKGLDGDRASETKRMGNFISDTMDLHKMYLERLQGVKDEKGVDMEPIVGVRAGPLLSFTEATQSLKKAVGAEALEEAAKYAKRVKSPELSTDEVAALHLYTLESNFYKKLNATLRDPNRKLAEPYLPYLRLFFSAFEKIKPFKKSLWRGVNLDLRSQYQVGGSVTWWGVSSCTSDRAVAEGFMQGKFSMLFEVRPAHAVSIMDYSAFQGEAEYLLAPGTQLEVVSSKTAGSVTTVVLQEQKDAYLVS